MKLTSRHSRVLPSKEVTDEVNCSLRDARALFSFNHTLTASFYVSPSISLQISFFLSSYVIPLALISILYVGMLIRLWHSVPGSKVSAESRRGKKRVTRMVVFVVLAFAICWLPIHVSTKAACVCVRVCVCFASVICSRRV